MHATKIVGKDNRKRRGHLENRRGLWDNTETDLKETSYMWTEFIWFRVGTKTRFCEHGNYTSDSVNTMELVESLATPIFLRKILR
jgi:hypothetical protein